MIQEFEFEFFTPITNPTEKKKKTSWNSSEENRKSAFQIVIFHGHRIVLYDSYMT